MTEVVFFYCCNVGQVTEVVCFFCNVSQVTEVVFFKGDLCFFN